MRKSIGCMVFGVAILSTTVLSLIVAFLFLGNQEALSSPTMFWVLAIASQAVLLGSSMFVLKRKKKAFFTTLQLDKKIDLKVIGLLFCLAVALIVFMLPIQTEFLQWLESLGLKSSSDNFPKIDSWPNFLLGVVFLATLPAVVEEVVFRGVIFQSFLGKSKRNIACAIVFSALLFSVMHQNPAQTLHPFILGVVMAFVFFVTGSLWASITLHFFNNFLVLCLEFFGNGSIEAFLVDNLILSSVVGVGLAVGLVFVLLKVCKGDKCFAVDETTLVGVEKTQDKQVALAWIVPAISFCVYMWIFVLTGMGG